MNLKFTVKFLAVSLLISNIVFVAEAQKLKPEAIVQTGQRGISALKISPNGKLLASAGSNDNDIFLWDIASSKLIRILEGHKTSVTDLSFSPDNKSLASCSVGNEGKIWDLTTGEVKVVLKVGNEKGIAFSPDGKFLAASDESGKSVNLWDIGKEAIIKNLEGNSDPIFSPDGKILYDKDRENVYAWDVKTGQKLFSFENQSRIISVSPDGKTIAVVDNEIVAILDAQTGKELIEITTNNSDLAVFTADGKGIIANSAFEDFKLWDVSKISGSKIYYDETKGVIKQFIEPENPNARGAVTPDGTKFISGNENNGIKVWNIESGKAIREFPQNIDSIYEISTSSNGENLLLNSGKPKNPPAFFNTNTNRFIRDWKSKSRLVEFGSIDFNPNQETLVIESFFEDKKNKIVNSVNGEEIGYFPDEFVVFSPNGKTFVTQPELLGKFSLRDAKTGELIKKFDGTEKQYASHTKLAFSKDGKTLGAIELNSVNELLLWEVESGKLISKLNLDMYKDQGDFRTPTRNVADLNIDAKIFATIRKNSQDVSIADLATGKEIKRFKSDLEMMSLFFSPDAKFLFLQSNSGIIEIRNTATTQIVGRISENRKNPAISFTKNGKRVIISRGKVKSGVVRNNPEAKVYDISNGELALTIRSFDDGNWIAYSPEGYYQASNDEVFGRVSWRVGTKVYDFERFFERYFKPDLIRQVFNSSKSDFKRNSVAKGFALPPEIKILSPENVKSTTSETIALTLLATDQGGGIKDLRLYQNGKRLSEKQRGILQPKESSVTFNVSLIAGKNVFRATAYSDDQTESEPFELIIERKAPAGKSDLYILAVGINVYKNPKYNLNYAGADAQALSLAIEKKGQGIYGKVYKTLLTDNLATKEGIEKAFKQIADQAKPQDSFIFFYAGHGILIETDADANKTFFLVPHDVIQIATDGGELSLKGISSGLLRDWTTQIKASKQLMMLDACQSGGAIQAFAERDLAEEKAISQLARSAGIVILTASGTEQQATEFKRLGHGVFTYALLQGLNGEADGNPSDRIITVSEIEAFLDRKVPELTKEYRGTTQYPQRYSRGQDFPIGIN
jgi:WD40 repeat protein